MSKNTVAQENIITLQSANINDLFLKESIQEIENEMVCYANLLVEKKTGKILKVTPSRKVLWTEDAISTPIAISKVDIFDSNAKLELARVEDLDLLLPLSKKELKQSIDAFNLLLGASKDKQK